MANQAGEDDGDVLINGDGDDECFREGFRTLWKIKTSQRNTFLDLSSKGKKFSNHNVSKLTKGKKAIFFAVPGAFTPTCSQKHLPGFVEKSGELKAKGIDTITCISVNDAFEMKAWKEDLKVGDDVLLLFDGNGTFTKAIGTELDLSDKSVGLGVRSTRYARLVDGGL